MADITIQDIDEELAANLWVQAAAHGHSPEDEARAILRSALAPEPAPAIRLGTSIRARFGRTGGVVLPPLVREAMHEPPDLG